MNEEEKEITEMPRMLEEDWFIEQLDPRVQVVVTEDGVERAQRSGTLVAEEGSLAPDHVLSVERRRIGLQVMFRERSRTIVPSIQT
jgi:hypothetical protein